MTSKATIGYLATFSIGSGSPVTMRLMAEVKSIKPNIATIPSIDATQLRSPDATEEKVPGLIKPGTVDISGNFIGDSSQMSILTLAQSRTLFTFQITAPINSGTQTYTLSGSGFISKFEAGPFSVSALTEFAMSLEIAGTVVETISGGTIVPANIFAGPGAAGATSVISNTGASAVLNTGDSLTGIPGGAESFGQTLGTFALTGQALYLLLVGGTHALIDANTGFPFAFKSPVPVSFSDSGGNPVSLFLYESAHELFGSYAPKVVS